MNAQEFVEQLLAHMGISDAKVEVSENDEGVLVTVSSSEQDSGMLIGSHGETANSLQRLVAASLKEQLGEKRISVNVNDYLERRKESLTRMAKQAADRVRNYRSPVTLPYLPSNERRIVHLVLQEETDVETRSEGEGRDRLLTVYPK